MQSPLRDLNLSYNLVNGRDGTTEFAHALNEFLRDPECSDNLTHINLSGLKFSQDDLLLLCEVLSGGVKPVKDIPKKSSDESQVNVNNLPFCTSLLSIHMSDMGLEFENELQEDILDMFGIGEDDNDTEFVNAMKMF
jgi:hypothetical protein